MKNLILFLLLAVSTSVWAQNAPAPPPVPTPEKDALRLNLNADGSHYFQVTFLNQVWLRYNQNNPGTLVENKPEDHTFDIGLRRTRIQMFGQITDKVFVYFQFGENNINTQFNTGNNRKLASFFHDALCEYKISKKNQLKLGGGLTIANGLSRFSQPSIGSIMTLDVPVFAQTTVDQTDEFSRKLSLYARGQIGKFDYRIILSDPFPVASSGASLPTLNEYANFAQRGHQWQQQGYLMYQFFEQEPHTTPYMTGTYLGKRKVFNIALGGIYQKDAMWRKGSVGDTIYQAMQHFSVESYLDMPVNREKETAVSAYVGYFNTNYGDNYLRYNGIMNVANGTNLTANNSIVGQGPSYGNAVPMFGTGNVIYAQFGFLLPKGLLGNGHKLMPYGSLTAAKYDRLNGLWANTLDLGINYFILGHKSKITLDWQNRPTFKVQNNAVASDKRRNTLNLQYQIFF
ncbi:MAG: hypothetical protein KGS48_13460 [Bacteroidetes bacterium]|nr:hypothetical protein [Bacteroidota bacterium]